jgi:hypothetical protein
VETEQEAVDTPADTTFSGWYFGPSVRMGLFFDRGQMSAHHPAKAPETVADQQTDMRVRAVA